MYVVMRVAWFNGGRWLLREGRPLDVVFSMGCCRRAFLKGLAEGFGGFAAEANGLKRREVAWDEGSLEDVV